MYENEVYVWSLSIMMNMSLFYLTNTTSKIHPIGGKNVLDMISKIFLNPKILQLF